MSPFHSWVDHSAGTNDFAPAIVVIFESARSAEPPQSSGITSAIALITLPDATRVETELPPSNFGSAASRLFGVAPVTTLSSNSFLSGFAAAHASNDACQAERASFACD